LNLAGFESEIEILDNCRINFCKGCKQCETDLRCVQKDDMDRIIENIKNADLLVLASPSYWGDVTAQMKVFIDRCTPLCEYINRQSLPEGKAGISISIRAGTQESENGYKKLIVGSSTKRTESHLFYQGIGFEYWKEQRLYSKTLER